MTQLVSLILIFWVVIYPVDSANQLEGCPIQPARWFMVYRTRNVWFCACVGLWFIERGILHLEYAFLGFCACVGLRFIDRGMCGFALVLIYVYRTRNWFL